MRIPRDLSGAEFARALGRLGYRVDHQTGSHIRLTTHQHGEHHVTVPAHKPLKLGTINGVMRDVGKHHGIDRDALMRLLFE